jgi:hypothetical protein
MGNATQANRRAESQEVCFRTGGRRVCLRPKPHLGNDCFSSDPLSCLTATEMHPVLRIVCSTDDWRQCLTRLASEERDDELPQTKTLGPDKRSDIPVSRLLPSLCAQLPKDKCQDYGEGARKVRCRWMPGGDERTGRDSCGALVQVKNPEDPETPAYVWKGSMGSDEFSWEE